MILHVRDSTQNDYDAHKRDVINIMRDLGIEYETDDRIFEVINKIDACSEERRAEIERDAKFNDQVLPISAQSGEGVEEMTIIIDEFLSRNWSQITYDIPVSDGKAIAWLYQHAEVLESNDKNDKMQIIVHIDPANQNRFESMFDYKQG